MQPLVHLSKKLHDFFSKGHSRTLKAKKNILASFVIKGLNVVLSFLIVRLTLNHLDQTLYGIWLTISSIIVWFNFFDIGLGNGLRNKFAEALAKDQKNLARIYVSTTYLTLCTIAGVIWVVFWIVYRFIDWSIIFNSDPSMSDYLGEVVLVVFSSFCIRFVTNITEKILVSDQQPAIANSFKFLSQIIILLCIYILASKTEPSLLNISAVLSGAPVVVLIVASLYLFNNQYREYSPSLKYVDLQYLRPLLSLGGQFFIIQLAALVLFTTDNMIITQLMGPSFVTPYGIAFKYFQLIPIAFGIIVNPLWSAFTEAYTKGEHKWIRKAVNKSLKIWCGLVVIVVIIVANIFYEFWLGSDLEVPYSLTFFMGFHNLLFTLNSIYVTFINGVGKLRLQIYTAIFSIIANIPLSYLFAVVLNFGLSGVIFATSCSILLSLILRPIQYKKLIEGTATGIWNK